MRAAWKIYPAELPPERCQQELRQMLASTELHPGGIHANNAVDPSFRRSRVGWPEKSVHAEFFSWVEERVQEANRQLWAFVLDGKSEWQLTHYTAQDSGMYRPHMDCSLSNGETSCRKLSVTVNLSDPRDYRGGSLQLGAVGQPNRDELRQQGTLFVFPAFVEHGVTTLLAGERYSLVAWFSGPNWR